MASKEAQTLRRGLEQRQEEVAPAQVNVAQLAGRVPTAADDDPVGRIPIRKPGEMDEQFPTDAFVAREEQDKIQEAKLQLQTPGQPGYTPFGKLEAKDEDFKWLERKAAAAEYANFQAWFAKEFDHMAPAEKKRAKELFPEFYAERMRMLKKNAENAVRLAKLKLEGIEDMDDLKTAYLAESGRLDLGPLQNLMHPELAQQGEAGAQQKFMRGLLNPWTIYGQGATLAKDQTVTASRVAQSKMYRSQVGTLANDSTQVGRQLGVTTGVVDIGATANKWQDQSNAVWYKKLGGVLQ